MESCILAGRKDTEKAVLCLFREIPWTNTELLDLLVRRMAKDLRASVESASLDLHRTLGVSGLEKRK
jgi:hypothetical protein